MTRYLRASERFFAGVLPEPEHVEHLIEQASDMAIAVDADGIVIGISVNPDCPTLGRLDHWVGRVFSDFLTDECKPKFADRVAALRAASEPTVRPIELNHVDNAKWEFPLRYTLHLAKESDAVLLIGRDLQPFAEIQQRLMREQSARERDLQKVRSAETHFRIVLEASETPIVLLDPGSGRITEINTAAADLLGGTTDLLYSSAFAQAFDGRRQSEFMDAISAAASADERRGIEVVSRRNGRIVRLCPKFFRASGDLVLLCSLQHMEDRDAAGPEFTQTLASLYWATTDAILLTDSKGNIREANEAFLVMTDTAQLRDVKDRSLADFLVRGGVDLKLMLENIAKHGRMRSYSAQIKSIVGNRATVDISTAQLRQRVGDVGVGFVIRDVTQSEATAPGEPSVMVSDDAMKHVMDLVGTASLKELVSATSDVIEKMCIETAVQLTGNNRVAAAEMLGLSRQSLYVKLRKHGLLKSGGENE